MTQPQTTTRHEIEQIRGEIGLMKKEISDISNLLTECSHALRGYNGTPGLISDMNTLKQLISNELAHLSERIEVVAKKEDPTAVRWPQLLERFFAPALVGLLTFLLAHFWGK